MIRSENIPNAYKEVYTILKYVSKDDNRYELKKRRYDC